MPIMTGPALDDVYYHFPQTSDEFREEIQNQDWPFLRETSDKPGAEHLCFVCSHINFKYLFRHKFYLGNAGSRVKPDHNGDIPICGLCLGRVSRIQEETSCDFCKLLQKILCNLPLEEDNVEHPHLCFLNSSSLRTYSEYSRRGDPNGTSEGCETGLSIHAKYYRRPAEENDDWNAVYQSSKVSLVYRTNRSNLAPTIDFKSCKTMIQQCLNVHQTGIYSGFTYLIDVRKCCLVKKEEVSGYVTLSYVSGTNNELSLSESNLEMLLEEGSLNQCSGRIGATIRDALTLCRELDEQYLWVDRLCIPPDPAGYDSVIQRMDQVLESARFNIIAAHGEDLSAGLPRVRADSRYSRQALVEIQGINMINLLDACSYVLHDTPWKSRAWNVQDRYLSSRKLIFKEDAVYYQCEHGEYPEDRKILLTQVGQMCFLVWHSANSLLSGIAKFHDSNHGRPMNNADKQTIFPQIHRSNFAQYFDVVLDYTSKTLSREDDVLNAFVGIGNALSKRLFEGSPMLAGIPLCCLDVGLLWIPFGRLKRREGFPTWSWAGWVGAAVWRDWRYPHFDAVRCGVDWIDAKTYVEKNERVRLDVKMTGAPPSNWAGWHKWRRKVDGDGQRYYVKKIGTARGKQPRISHPITPAGNLSPFISTHGLLLMDAEIGQFFVPRDRTITKLSINSIYPDVFEALIYDRDGVQAGKVVIDRTTFDNTNFATEEFSFIKLSNTTIEMGSRDPGWDHESKTYVGSPGAPGTNPRAAIFRRTSSLFDTNRYPDDICFGVWNVLMVEWKGDVAHRVGVGKVHLYAFEHVDSERRLVKLG